MKISTTTHSICSRWTFFCAYSVRVHVTQTDPNHSTQMPPPPHPLDREPIQHTDVGVVKHSSTEHCTDLHTHCPKARSERTAADYTVLK